eukprot:3752737-Prymnesium_polylepis.1
MRIPGVNTRSRFTLTPIPQSICTVHGSRCDSQGIYSQESTGGSVSKDESVPADRHHSVHLLDGAARLEH